MSDEKPFISPLDYHPFHGQSSYTVACSKCGELFRLYVWSFHGCGKKCPKCKQLYGLPNVRQPEVVKYEGRWVNKVGKWLYSYISHRWVRVE